MFIDIHTYEFAIFSGAFACIPYACGLFLS